MVIWMSLQKDSEWLHIVQRSLVYRQSTQWLQHLKLTCKTALHWTIGHQYSLWSAVALRVPLSSTTCCWQKWVHGTCRDSQFCLQWYVKNYTQYNFHMAVWRSNQQWICVNKHVNTAGKAHLGRCGALIAHTVLINHNEIIVMVLMTVYVFIAAHECSPYISIMTHKMVMHLSFFHTTKCCFGRVYKEVDAHC